MRTSITTPSRLPPAPLASVGAVSGVPARLGGLALIGLWLVTATPVGIAVAHAAEPQGAASAPSTCDTSKSAEASHAATPPQGGANSGTAPGSQGNTGWTNGNGGSFVGTSNHAETPGSPTRQPETVTGVNPGTADRAPKPC